MIISEEEYRNILLKIEDIPFTQTVVWCENEMQSFGFDIVYYADSIENPCVACSGRVTNKPVLGKKLMIDGICKKKDVTFSQLESFFSSLLAKEFSIVEISDISPYCPEFEVAIRKAGFIRPLALSLCPMSLIVDLQQDSWSFHRNWRRNVKKSINEGNEFVVVDSPHMEDAVTFVTLFNELKSRKNLHFSLSANQVYALISNGYRLFFIKNKDGHYIAGRIEYECGDLVYDVYAANSDEAIKTGAAYQIQESIFRYYHKKGFAKFDYGRISPSANRMNDIYLSKSYSGGNPIGYNGQWCWYKSQLIEYLYSFLIFYLHKHSRY